jgi:hypothetical protein
MMGQIDDMSQCYIAHLPIEQHAQYYFFLPKEIFVKNLTHFLSSQGRSKTRIPQPLIMHASLITPSQVDPLSFELKMPAFSRALAVASEIVVPIPDGDPRLRIPTVSAAASLLRSPSARQLQNAPRSSPPPSSSSAAAAGVSAAASLAATFASSPLNSGSEGDRFNFEALSENDSLQFLNVCSSFKFSHLFSKKFFHQSSFHFYS